MARRIFFTLALAIVLFSSAHAQTAKKSPYTDSWKTWLVSALEVKRQGIENLIAYRTLACASTLSVIRKEACIAGYTAVIARRQAEKAEIEAWITFVRLDPSEATQLINDDVSGKVNVTNSETQIMFEKLWQVFPAFPNTKVRQ